MVTAPILVFELRASRAYKWKSLSLMGVSQFAGGFAGKPFYGAAKIS